MINVNTHKKPGSRVSYIGTANVATAETNTNVTGSHQPPEIGTLDTVSPYLIHPEDDLIIGFQYPVTSEPVFVQPFGDQKEFGMELLGDAKIRLIGSLVSDG